MEYNYKKIDKQFVLFFVTLLLSLNTMQAQVPDPDQGLRAEWMRGALGVLWLPERNYNGNIEGVTIDDFITQIKDLRTLDFVQIGLVSPNIFSPVHTAPHPIIESLWEGDTDDKGNPVNLTVPRASTGDPFLSWLIAINNAGLKVEVYVNSYNLLARIPASIPDAYPDLSARWEAFCNTNPEAQAFINNHPYIKASDPARRKYMFCYAEFILKAYAERYGDLIHAWCFDSADNIMENECGDDPASEDVNDQRIYQAFADACHAGNPNAAVAFNNSVGDRVANPFSTATYFDDYTFGHPFGGAGDMVENETLYTYNFHVVQWLQDYAGYAFKDDNRAWNDNVVGHFFPKQSTTSWNAGATPCLTDSQFVAWNSVGLINGGGITWGTPLVRTNLENSPVLTLQPYALNQFLLTDAHLKAFQYPGAPNWARQSTVLSDAVIGQAYTHALLEGVDLWDPEGDEITELLVVTEDGSPSWLSVSETSEGTWTLSGTPDDTASTAYNFRLRAKDASGERDRMVTLKVIDPGAVIPVTKISMFPRWFQLNKDETSKYNLTTVLYPLNASNQSVTWSSSDPSLATVNTNGLVTALDTGVVIITATTLDGGLRDSCELRITANSDEPVVDPDGYVEVEIKAAEDSTYGVNTVATLVSETLTAPDGKATFQISIDVSPKAGKSIASGVSGGVSTTRSWGITGDGRETTKDFLFFGDSLDWADLGNAKVINFNANGGDLTLDDFDDVLFGSITVVNAQSARKDAVAYKLNGTTTELGNVATSPFTIDIPDVENFSIGNGTSVNQLANKWSVEGVTVKYRMATFYSLAVTSEGGSVLKTPDLSSYKSGTEVTLSAVADPSYSFVAWEGDIAGASIAGSSITVVMDADKTISATFSMTNALEETAQSPLLSISPNPSNGIFTVTSDKELKGTYTVYSLNGTRLIDGTVSGSLELDMRPFEKGMYLLKMTSDQGLIMKKIILN